MRVCAHIVEARKRVSGPSELELHMGCWDLNWGLLQEQLTTKPFLQLCFVLFYFGVCMCVYKRERQRDR